MAITRAEMLTKMGISDADFRDYLTKHGTFLKSLNESQTAFHKRNNPGTPVNDIARSLGPGVTSTHVKTLFSELPPVQGVSPTNCCRGGQPVGAKGNLA